MSYFTSYTAVVAHHSHRPIRDEHPEPSMPSFVVHIISKGRVSHDTPQNIQPDNMDRVFDSPKKHGFQHSSCVQGVARTQKANASSPMVPT